MLQKQSLGDLDRCSAPLVFILPSRALRTSGRHQTLAPAVLSYPRSSTLRRAAKVSSWLSLQRHRGNVTISLSSLRRLLHHSSTTSSKHRRRRHPSRASTRVLTARSIHLPAFFGLTPRPLHLHTTLSSTWPKITAPNLSYERPIPLPPPLPPPLLSARGGVLSEPASWHSPHQPLRLAPPIAAARVAP